MRWLSRRPLRCPCAATVGGVPARPDVGGLFVIRPHRYIYRPETAKPDHAPLPPAPVAAAPDPREIGALAMRTRSQVIAAVYDEWAADQRTTPDRAYAHDGPSQYPEGIDALSAPTSAQADLYRRTQQALRDAGPPVTPI